MRLSEKDQQALVVRLATFESPWRPLRHNYDAAGAVAAARRERGYSAWLAAIGSSPVSWKANQRTRDRLVDAGLMDGEGGLTAEGKRLARRLTWPWELRELVEALRRIQVRTASRDVLRNTEVVPETLVCGHQWDGKTSTTFASLQMVLVPTIADQFVVTGSTSRGNAYFGLDTTFSPEEIAVLTIGGMTDLDHKPHLAALYCKVYSQVWHSILSDKRSFSDIGSPPLRSDKLESGRDQNTPGGIPTLFKEEANDR